MNIPIKEGQKISSVKCITNILTDILNSENEIDRQKEHMWVVGLDTQNVIKYIELANLGTRKGCACDPTSIFRLAVMKNIDSIIIAHNHPSGNVRPSEDDIKFSNKIHSAGNILMIRLLDSLIITEDPKNSFSFLEEGMITIDK